MIGIVYPINIGGKCKLFIFRMKSPKLIFSCFFPAFFLLFHIFSCFFPAFNYRIFNIKLKKISINIEIEMEEI
jgi:hypothetical protein